ncbi:MAG: acyl-CoA reductase-like NAD-dependent aldehyde dehydrogenase, partial [Paracoccaceae bacterium]
MLDKIATGPQIKGMYIGGRWASGTGTFADINPSDDTEWAKIPDAGRVETRVAIEAAQAAFVEWSELPFTHRARFMLKVANVWEKRIPDFVAAMQNEGGGWVGKGGFEGGYVTEVFRAAAAATYGPIGEVLPSEHGKVSTAVRYPMGVVAVISPWNFPAILSSRGFAFPMAAGNTIVLKPSEDTPYTGGL